MICLSSFARKYNSSTLKLTFQGHSMWNLIVQLPIVTSYKYIINNHRPFSHPLAVMGTWKFPPISDHCSRISEQTPKSTLTAWWCFSFFMIPSEPTAKIEVNCLHTFWDFLVHRHRHRDKLKEIRFPIKLMAWLNLMYLCANFCEQIFRQ